MKISQSRQLAILLRCVLLTWGILLAKGLPSVVSQEPNSTRILTESEKESVKLGRDFILNKRYLPPDFDQETFDQVWRVWPDEMMEKAKPVSADVRREMAFRRYGFTAREDDPTKPLQFVVDKQGKWCMNCFSCHGGGLYGDNSSVEGLPNNQIALTTLYSDIRKVKRLLKKPFGGNDLGSAIVPMGTTDGTSNAVIFGVILMSFRDKDINLKTIAFPPIVQHHDMDAPPWWNTKHKKMLYIDGFLEKHHRALMPFMMVKQNDGPRFRGYESDFKAIGNYIESLQPPRYKGEIDHRKAQLGKVLFRKNCARCHGTYEPELRYPEKRIELEEVGTDPVRLGALSTAHRKGYKESWLADYGKVETIIDPDGYVAPPLVGIWATAPYFHNGSVPTLRGVLDPRQRPEIWTRKELGFDELDVGLKFETVKKNPERHLIGRATEIF